MKMTKKHYIKIAKAFKENKSRIELIMALCEIFKADNKNIDDDKFIKAVGIELSQEAIKNHQLMMLRKHWI